MYGILNFYAKKKDLADKQRLKLRPKLFYLYTNADNKLYFSQEKDLNIGLGKLDVTEFCIKYQKCYN